MFCTKCGAQIADGSAHCTSCGARVESVGAAASILTNVATAAYAGLDHDFRKSLFLGGGSVFASVLTLLLPGPSGIFILLLLPTTVVLGIMALNAGRDLRNRAGYYLGMTGFVAGAASFYALIVAYAVSSAAASLASSWTRGLF